MKLTARTIYLSIYAILLPLSVIAGDYWQQEVNYSIDVQLATDLRTVTGQARIEYINHSPDTLAVLYLKAYPNAVQRDSYADLKRRRDYDYSLARLAPEQQGRLEIYSVPNQPSSGSGAGVAPAPFIERATETDNTIITVRLDNPLMPGDTFNLALGFTTVLPQPAQMRMGTGGNVTKAVYWFPQVCVYDRELGWVNSQYIGWGECYGDFGRFDVNITAPEDQIVAATGVCMNQALVLPDTLRRKLAIENFLVPRDQWPAFDFDGNRTRTWHYVANDVNDFVFTASSQFCIDSGSVNGVAVVAYPLRNNAGKWRGAVRLGEEAITTFSELYLPYQWPVIRICDAYSGMEYPMLTNCSRHGSDNGFALLLYHEIGHQWFMGQIGFNQVDRPFLDEGATTHAEHNAMEKYLGREGNLDNFTNWYQRTFSPHVEDRYQRGFYPLLMLMKEEYDQPMVFSFDRAPEYWPYRVSAYYKSAAMHYSLRSIFGDSDYYAAMQHFCRQWLFKHPYEDDFTASLEEATGVELTEYLRQWYYGRDRLDYAYAGREVKRDGDRYEHTIKLKNEGGFVAPIDVAVIYPQGDTTFYTIPPEGMSFDKPGYVLLPEWPQFRRDQHKYEFTVKARRDILKVVVDPHQLLMDINRLNNQAGHIPPLDIRLDNLKYDRTPLDKYALRIRPDFWYDEPNGLLVGLHSHGSYLEKDMRFNLDAAVGIDSWRPTVDASCSNPFSLFGNNSDVTTRILRADRRTFFSNSYEKRFKRYYSRPDQELFRLELNYLDVGGYQENRLVPLTVDYSKYYAESAWDATYTFYVDFTTGSMRTFRYGYYSLSTSQLIGNYEEDGRQRGFIQSGYDFNLNLGTEKRYYLTLDLGVESVSGQPPSQFLHHISRAPAMESFARTRMFRSPGTFPIDWRDDFYLAAHGVRGYQDRVLYLTDSWFGALSLTPPDLLPFRWLRHIPLVGGVLSRVDQSLFVDAAAVTMDARESLYPYPISQNETAAEGEDWTIFVSAGLSLDIPAIWKGQRLRLDFPVYLNKPLPGDDELAFRFSVAWLLPTLFEL